MNLVRQTVLITNYIAFNISLHLLLYCWIHSLGYESLLILRINFVDAILFGIREPIIYFFGRVLIVKQEISLGYVAARQLSAFVHWEEPNVIQ